MTDHPGRLEAIRERWERATPGPWRASGEVAQGKERYNQHDVMDADNDQCLLGCWWENAAANAEAIAHAPTDIAYLLERLGEAEALLDEWHGAFTANAEMRTREWLANVIARTSAFLSEPSR